MSWSKWLGYFVVGECNSIHFGTALVICTNLSPQHLPPHPCIGCQFCRGGWFVFDLVVATCCQTLLLHFRFRLHKPFLILMYRRLPSNALIFSILFQGFPNLSSPLSRQIPVPLMTLGWLVLYLTICPLTLFLRFQLCVDVIPVLLHLFSASEYRLIIWCGSWRPIHTGNNVIDIWYFRDVSIPLITASMAVHLPILAVAVGLTSCLLLGAYIEIYSYIN